MGSKVEPKIEIVQGEVVERDDRTAEERIEDQVFENLNLRWARDSVWVEAAATMHGRILEERDRARREREIEDGRIATYDEERALEDDHA